MTDATTARPMDTLKHWRIEAADNVCRLLLDKCDSSQNVLSFDVIAELGQALTQIESTGYTGLIIGSAKSAGFIVGADVGEFKQVSTAAEAAAAVHRAHRVINQLEQFPLPTVAMINGHCLGGGLELALACRYRVVCDQPDIRLGLPEVMLGIHPGFGGSVRLIETAGVPAAMDLMLSGRTVVPKVAHRMGIVDLAVPGRQLLRAAHFVLNQNAARRPGGRRPILNRILNSLPARAILATWLRRQVAAKANPVHYPAPGRIIQLWREHGNRREQMLNAEVESVAELVVSPTARHLIGVFGLREGLKKCGKAGPRLPDRLHVHVIGAGVMGGDIAAWCALQGCTVTLHDQSADALAHALRRAGGLFKRKLKQPRRVQNTQDRLQADSSGAGAAKADVLIEAIVEHAEAKISLFTQLQAVARPDAILATNTSSIPLETLSASLSQPGRLVGLHFFNPVAKMPLLEIIKSARTDTAVVQSALAFADRINRLPVLVNSSPGFLVNRVLMPYLLEAVELHTHGTPAPIIDQAAKNFGMPMGPLELADTVGLDICQHVAANLSASYGGEVPAVLQQKVTAGTLGKKTGAGFYHWRNGKPDKPRANASGSSSTGDIEQRLVLRYLNETVACLHEGVVENARQIDAGLIFATGFAPFRGGPIAYIIDQGQAAVLARLETFHGRYGDRFAPCRGWSELDLAAQYAAS